MITQQNFKDVLRSLGFARSGNIFSHQPGGHLMQADFDAQKLLYPDGLAIEGEFTTNFSSNENFVVFECVHRLLSLGYQPSHITLEPKWKLGHGASGGRADIQIKNNNGEVFALIECKTAGKEFDEAWEYMQLHPSQLFSYAQQERTTQVLCLYASDWDGLALQRQYHALSLRDNAELLLDDSLTYARADTAIALFNAWKQTYGGEATSLGLFEDGSAPLLFGKKVYSLADLQPIALADIQKKYHRFATILRKHNVSGRENAFDKLVNLFLCKVVDEKENPANLKFYWKGLANDTAILLQDRLQNLYQQGMKRFLKEDVTYISQEQIDNAFRFLDPKDPDATKKVINDYFKRLKFYTNNDFAFIEVHNEALFKKNADVLLEVIEMLQGIRLVGDEETHTNQFLGDMFEGFLDAGVKQSEGQFFTPMPIVKFIMAALPLAHIVAEADAPPKAIDYACGAGHFLTELAQKLKPHALALKTDPDIREYYRAITGIEKEYRLSKVAKVSAFMYGQDDINIIHADALAQNPQVAEGSYHILVANPPYSVKGFLETLTERDRRSYDLYNNIDAKSTARNNAIETFFIERAARLLAPGGVAAIILPSSILSNDGSQYQKTREILLRRFHICAIAELGSGTFGKTGTNTVTLFLRRRAGEPSEEEHYRTRAADWAINGDTAPGSKKNGIYQDLYLLEAYAAHIGIPFADYEAFLRTGTANGALRATEWWGEYEKAFAALASTKNHQKKSTFKALAAAGRAAELAQLLSLHVRGVEEDKIYFFLLAAHNGGEVLVIRSPADGKAMKKFLGYEWSSAKGAEGIKYLGPSPALPEGEGDGPATASGPSPALPEGEGDSPSPALPEGEGDGDEIPKIATAQLASIQTPLYNPANDDDDGKLSFFIRQSFLGAPFALPESLKPFAHKARLVDMLDFGRKDFGKFISLTPKKTASASVFKYPTVRVETILEKIAGSIEKVPENEILSEGKYPVVTQEAGILISGYVNNGDPIQDLPLIVFGDHNCSIKYVDFPFLRGADGTKLLKPSPDKFIPECFYYLLQALEIPDKEKYERHYKYLAAAFIPVPPKDIQAQIVAECRAVDEAVSAAEAEIKAARGAIEGRVKEAVQGLASSKLPQWVDIISGGTPDTKNPAYWSGDIPWLSVADFSKGGRFVSVTEKHISEAGLKNSNTRYLQPGDLIISARGTVGALAELAVPMTFNQSCYGLHPKEGILSGYLYYILKRETEQFKGNAAGVTFGAITIKSFENIRIPVPSLSIQQALLADIEKEEARIGAAQLIIAEAPARKAAVLRAHLE